MSLGCGIAISNQTDCGDYDQDGVYLCKKCSEDQYDVDEDNNTYSTKSKVQEEKR